MIYMYMYIKFRKRQLIIKRLLHASYKSYFIHSVPVFSCAVSVEMYLYVKNWIMNNRIVGFQLRYSLYSVLD